METKDILLNLRTKAGLTQDALAGKVFVTRQAVSRWETGETVPGPETLKLLSALFGVSIDALLGSPHRLICQCCGMPLEDPILGRNRDGSLSEDYCKWCYADGEYMYSDLDELIEVCVHNMADAAHPADEVRAYLRETLPQLDYWKHRGDRADGGPFEALKKQLLDELNALDIPGLPRVERLYALLGRDVNLSYPLPGGGTARFLRDETTYLGNQLPSETEKGRYFGVLADRGFLLVCTYGEGGKDPRLLLYKTRDRD